MPSTPHNLINYIRAVAGAWRNDPREDAELITGFAESRDEMAFAALVWRHAGMVWRTCRHVLGNTPDAEDAFQSAFLALSRKAGRFPVKNLAGWLHRVARQTALDIDAAARRRRNLEQRQRVRAEMTPEVKRKDSQTELSAVLDEELAGLAERLRVPLVLHFLENKSQEEVARILGCARSVVRKRLAKGEAVLRERLERRGLALGALPVAAILGDTSSNLPVPGRLIESTARAAVEFRSGAIAGTSAVVAERVLRSLSLEGMMEKSWWIVLVCVGALGIGGAGRVVWRMYGNGSDAKKPEAMAVPTAPVSVAKPHKEKVDLYGDPLPEGALARLGTVRLRNMGIFSPILFMPDGKRLFTAGQERLLEWEFPSGKRLLNIDNYKSGWSPDDSSTANALTADGKLLAVGRYNGDVVLRDPYSGKRVGQLKVSTQEDSYNPVLALAFSSDGKILISGTKEDKTIRFWDVATGREARRLKITQIGNICGMAFTHDLRTVAVGQESGLVRLLDLETGKFSSDMRVSKGGCENISLVFSADGQKLAALGQKCTGGDPRVTKDTRVTLWDVATCKELLSLTTGSVLRPLVKISPNGEMLAASDCDGQVWLWNAKTGENLRTIRNGLLCTSIAFSPDSKILAVGGPPRQGIKLWEIATGKLLSPEGHNLRVGTVTFAPDGKSLASGNLEGLGWNKLSILIWDIETQKLCHHQMECGANENYGRILAYSPDNKTLASVGRDDAALWDTTTGNRLRNWKADVSAAAFSMDSKTLALAKSAAAIDLCEVSTGKPLHNLMADDDLKCFMAMAFLPVGRKLAAAYENGMVIWDPTTGEQLQRFIFPEPLMSPHPHPSMGSAAFSLDGRMLFIGRGVNDKALRLWEIASGQERLKIPLEENQDIQVAFSPDGRLMASANVDQTIRLWDAFTGQQLHQFPPGQGKALSLAFAPDGKTLASGNEDTTVLIWDVTPWMQKQNHPTVVSAAELQASWSDLAATDASRAYQAIGKLVAASDQAVPLLSEHLANSARMATTVSQRITGLLSNLDSDDFQVRDRARKELQEIDWDAEPLLRHALQSNLSLEQRQSVKRLLEKGKVNGVSVKLLRKLRGVEVLERIHTVAAQQVLQKLAEVSPPGDGVGEEVRAALQRLKLQMR